jgi:hypothetical protein
VSLKQAQDAAGGRGNPRLDRLPQDIERLLPVAAAASRLDVDALRRASQPDAARDRPARPGEPAAAQCPGNKIVCEASGFWRGGPTLYKFLYVPWADMVARLAAPCVDSVDRR